LIVGGAKKIDFQNQDYPSQQAPKPKQEKSIWANTYSTLKLWIPKLAKD
jgi:hypothetical protein